MSQLQLQPQLTLYAADYCPYCRRVQATIKELGVIVEQKDTSNDPEAKAELLRVGGKTTIPCLFIEGKPMYESADIISYLHTL